MCNILPFIPAIEQSLVNFKCGVLMAAVLRSIVQLEMFYTSLIENGLLENWLLIYSFDLHLNNKKINVYGCSSIKQLYVANTIKTVEKNINKS